nr:MAG TPA: hypothetical protein [Caudoviricetes sp.]
MLILRHLCHLLVLLHYYLTKNVTNDWSHYYVN